MREYVGNLLVATSRFLNALIGGHPNHTLSRRIGRSMLTGGLASYVPWPKWLRDHFLDSA